MTYTPECLSLWTLPDHYAGESWPDHYVFLGQHRDSDSLTRSNFSCGLSAIGGETDTVLVVHEGHWAVGWVQWIAIHKTDEKALRIADDITSGLADYPVVDETNWSELEYAEAAEYWASMSVRDRVDTIQHSGSAYVSIFAARRDGLPEGDDDSAVLDYLNRV